MEAISGEVLKRWTFIIITQTNFVHVRGEEEIVKRNKIYA